MEIFNLILLQPLINALLLFYHLLFNNLGLAIIALTVCIRAVLTPITLPSMRSMQVMRDLAPEISKLKKKYKDDKKRLMQAQSDLYKSKGVNPAAGCLPQIVQLVVLIALFQVFTHVLPQSGDIVEGVNKYAYEALRIDQPLNTRFLYLDLTKPDVFHLPNLPFPAPGPFLLLAALLQLVSSKMMAPAVKKAEQVAAKTKGEMDDIMASTQQQMLYLFPLMTIFVGLTFASGLVLYWSALSLGQVLQQYFVSGWGGLTPWLFKLNLVKSSPSGK